MRLVFALLLLAGSPAVALAADPAVSVSASGRILHDTNLFLADPAPLAAGQAQPGEPFRAEVTAVDAAASLGLAWRTAAGSADFGYAPEALRYLRHESESHTDHTLTLNAAGAGDAWTADVKARYLATQGPDASPNYNGLGGSPGIGGEPVRARRAQDILRFSGKLSRSLGHGFVRTVVAAYDQDFHTQEHATPGYCNYADRREYSAGLEAGEAVAGPLALVGGMRVGAERQANELGIPINYSNTFTRWLGGVEGSVGHTWKIAALAGPDVRHFGDSVRDGFQREQRTWYGEGSLQWTPLPATSFALTAKRYLWLIASGRGAYTDGLVDLSWRQTLSPTWSFTGSANWHDGGFNRYTVRHDRIYTGTFAVTRGLAHHARITLELMHDWAVTFIPNTPSRAYTRWIGSLSVGQTW